MGEIVRYLPHKKISKISDLISAASQTVATARIAPTICQGQYPNNVLTVVLQYFIQIRSLSVE